MQTLRWNATNPATGQPYKWGEKNLRWGSPSIILEPGDPGYTPPLSTQQPIKTKKHNMKRQRYFPARVADQVPWLVNFYLKLAIHGANLAVAPARLASITADARWLVYVLGSWLPAVRAWQKSCTDAAAQAQSGPNPVLMALPTFTAPALPAAVGGLPAVVPVAEGALERIFALVAEIRPLAASTEMVETDLGIVGPEESGPDFATLQADITAKVAGNLVEIGWGWGGHRDFLDQLEIQVDRGDGQGWTPLTFDTTPGYNDTHPFPAALTRWKYRAIYRAGDAQVGLWSATIEVVVGG